MTRVNLLRWPPESGAGRIESIDRRATAAGAAVLLITGAVIGVWQQSVGRGAAAMQREQAVLEQQKSQLRPIVDEVERLELRRAALQQRVALIRRLRARQTQPVRLFDALARSVPEGLWLTELRQQGQDLRLEGRSTSLLALADFIGRLEGSGQVVVPVEILNSQVDGEPSGDLVRFSIGARLVSSEP